MSIIYNNNNNPTSRSNMGNELNKSVSSKNRKQYMTEKLVAKVDELFGILDGDDSKTLEKEEVIARFELNNRNKDEAERFFRVFDMDKSGTITYQEFLEFWIQLRNKSTEE